MNKGRVINLAYYGLVILILLVSWYTLASSDDAENPNAGMMLKLAMALAVVAVIAAVFAFVVNIIRNFGESKNMVIGLLAMIVIIGIAYSMASSEVFLPPTQEPVAADFAASRWSGAGLITTGIVAALTVAASLFFGIKNILNN